MHEFPVWLRLLVYAIAASALIYGIYALVNVISA